jgi:hypothetical protein
MIVNLLKYRILLYDQFKIKNGQLNKNENEENISINSSDDEHIFLTNKD